MAAGNVNILVGCENCKFADEWGRNCKYGLMFPVMVIMSDGECPNFEYK